MSRYFKLICTYLLLTLLSSNAKAEISPTHWNVILTQYRPYNDGDRLKESFETLIEKSKIEEKPFLQIIYKSLLADLYSKKNDKKNSISERLYHESITLAEQTRHTGILIWANTQFGNYYYTYSEYISALPYFLKTSRALESFPESKIPEVSRVLIKNAYFFGTIDDNDKSIELLETALKLTPHTSNDYGSILYAIGAVYLKENDLEKAEAYFLRTIESANTTDDEVRRAKALGELANIYGLRGDTDKAKRYLLEDIDISEKKGDQRNTMYAQIQLGKLYFKLGNLEKAEQVISNALSYATTKLYLKGFEKEILELQLKIAQTKHDDQSELELRKKLDKIYLHLSVTDGQEIVDKVNWQTQKERIKWQLEAEQAKLDKSSILKWTWASVSFLLGLIIILTFLSYKRRLKFQSLRFERKLLSFEFEKIRSEQFLTETNNTLSSYQVYLEKKNEQIDQLEYEIDKIKNESERQSLESLLDSHLMTDENWMLFKNAFIAEKEDFYYDVLNTLPALTESNLRIILLQKLGLNNQEVANLLGITIDAVKKSKQRMRKKYGETLAQVLKEPSYV
ncbi:tetratricopeptide repeat protein [Pedobacter antarcticus]|uniref:tetratricopeptide repeat protein n=1 Tax=Pedobacter antarcticus TaxID=34086 RepID=UPI00292F2BC2|nr:tetratricopeptide repeat protein [Pedobacter antarcticus]